MTKAQVQALITLSVTIAACSGSDSTSVPESDSGVPEAGAESGADSGEPETPTSWTRSYTTLSGESNDLQEEWQRVPQVTACLTSDGRIFFPGLASESQSLPKGIVLSPSGQEVASFGGDVFVHGASCRNDQITVSGLVPGQQREAHLAGGSFTNPPSTYSVTPYLAAVGLDGVFDWGRTQEATMGTLLIGQRESWVWNFTNSGAIDLGCGRVAAQSAGSDWDSAIIGDILAAFGPDGKCVWSRRVVQKSGLDGAGVTGMEDDGAGGLALLYSGGNETNEGGYDAAVEHFDSTGKSLWITSLEKPFGDAFWGKIVRSQGDGGYFVGRMNSGGSNSFRQPMVTKLSAEGAVQWTVSLATWAYGRLMAFAPDSDGGLLFGGRFEVSSNNSAPATICGQTFAPQAAANGTGMDGFLGMLDDAGNCKWVKVYSTPQMDEVTAVLASPVDSTVVVFWEEWPVSEGYGRLHTSDLHITKFRP